jgi:hypothetical protein
VEGENSKSENGIRNGVGRDLKSENEIRKRLLKQYQKSENGMRKSMEEKRLKKSRTR